MNNNDKNKILLCACIKYFRKDKNGILLLNIILGENENVEDYFYETKSFEVYCFCLISFYKKIDNNILNEKFGKYKTNYFLVGGFEPNKNQGIIKLYQLINNKKEKKIEIKYIEDILMIRKIKIFRVLKVLLHVLFNQLKMGVY